MIPKQTTPLTKLIRTTEGWIVVGCNVGLIVVPIITNALPVKTAALAAAGLNAVTMASRSFLKATVALSPIFGSPIQPTGIGAPDTGSDPDPTAEELEQGPSMAEAPDAEEPIDPSILTELGAPHDQIKAAGAPDEMGQKS